MGWRVLLLLFVWGMDTVCRALMATTLRGRRFGLIESERSVATRTSEVVNNSSVTWTDRRALGQRFKVL